MYARINHTGTCAQCEELIRGVNQEGLV